MTNEYRISANDMPLLPWEKPTYSRGKIHIINSLSHQFWYLIKSLHEIYMEIFLPLCSCMDNAAFPQKPAHSG